MCDPAEVSIYRLVDLDTGAIVYVGASYRPLQRLNEHRTQATNQRMRQYFATHRIGMELVATVAREQAHAVEVAAIHEALDAGWTLLNTHTFGWSGTPQLSLFAI